MDKKKLLGRRIKELIKKKNISGMDEEESEC